MSIETTYDAYAEFTAIRFHFKQNYDYFKYNGKVLSVSSNGFEQFKGKHFLHLVLQRHRSHFTEFISTGYAYDPNLNWITDFISGEVEDIWIKHQRNMESLSRRFEKDAKYLLNDETDIKNVFLSDGFNLPKIEKSRLSGLTILETSVIMEKIFGYIGRNECENPLWENTQYIARYAPFMKIELSKYIKILKGLMP